MKTKKIKTFFGEFSLRNLVIFRKEITKNLLFFLFLAVIVTVISIIHCLAIGNIVMAIVTALIFFVLVKFFIKTKKTKFFVRFVIHEDDGLGTKI